MDQTQNQNTVPTQYAQLPQTNTTPENTSSTQYNQATQTNTAPEATVSTTPPKKSKKTFKIILIVLLILIGLPAVFLLSVILTTQKPLQAANNFLTAFSSQNTQAAYDLTSPMFKQVVSLENFTILHNEYKDLGLDKAKLIGRSTSKESGQSLATLKYSYTYESQDFVIEIKMIKSEDQWLVNEFTME